MQNTDTLIRIYNHLLINVEYLSNHGLYYGKTGCLIFFAQVARLFDDEIADEVVVELINEIFSSIGNIFSLNIPDGLCGIGWGVEYILQNQLMEGDSDYILADLDKMIQNNQIETVISSDVLADVIQYVAIRLTSICGLNRDNPFPCSYLLELYQAAQNTKIISDFSINNYINIIKKVLEKGRFRRKPLILTLEMTGQVSFDKFPFIPLGLHNGLSGLGIKLLKRN